MYGAVWFQVIHFYLFILRILALHLIIIIKPEIIRHCLRLGQKKNCICYVPCHVFIKNKLMIISNDITTIDQITTYLYACSRSSTDELSKLSRLGKAKLSDKKIGRYYNTFWAVNFCSLWWRHNERDSVSNHQPNDCLPNRLFRRR